MIQAEANLGNRNNIVDRHPILEAYPRLNAFTRAVGTLMGRAMNGGDRIIRNLANTFDLENRHGGTRLIDMYNEQFRRLNQRGIDILHEEALTMNDAVDEQRREQRRNEIMQNAGEVPGIVDSLTKTYLEANVRYSKVTELPGIDRFFENPNTNQIIVERNNDDNSLNISIEKTRVSPDVLENCTSINSYKISKLKKIVIDNEAGNQEVDYEADIDFSYSDGDIIITTKRLTIKGNSTSGFRIEGIKTNNRILNGLMPEIAEIGYMLDETYAIRNTVKQLSINLAGPLESNKNPKYNYEGKDGFKFNSSEL
jgi:hypothetical protein